MNAFTSRVSRGLFLLLFLFISASLSAKGTPQAPLDTINLLINDIKVVVEVAASNRQKEKGLSYRTSLAENAGMLFVFQKERLLYFTMRETLIPLSIAFISEDMTINEILEMEAGAEQSYPSRLRSRYALEMNSGWFSRNNIAVGAKLQPIYSQ